jgi:hypothetical protein
MENSEDNEYSREFVDGVISDYMARKKKSTNIPDADNANSDQRVFKIPAANPDAAPANNNQGVSSRKTFDERNPGSSITGMNGQQQLTRNAIIGSSQSVIPLKECINISGKDNSENGLRNDRVITPETTGSSPAANEEKPVTRKLTDCEKEKLRPYIPDVDMNNATIHDGEVPWYLKKEYIGIARGNDIYFRPQEFKSSTVKGLGLLGHELTHVGQYRKGMNGVGYLWRCRNYPDCDYEKEASATENKIKSELKEVCYPDKIKK